MKKQESHARTARVLGLWGLVALGLTANLAVIGIIVITLYPTAPKQTSDALTGLASVAAAGIGALAGWISRGQMQNHSDKMLDSAALPATLKPEAEPDSTIR